MRCKLNFFAAVLLVYLTAGGTFPAGLAFAEDPKEGETIDLHECTDEELGVTFFCNPGWSLETEDDVMFIVIREDPAVTLTIARSADTVIHIENLTTEVLRQLGDYMPGFITTVVSVDENFGISVEGFSQGYPDIRLLDYYIVHDYELYSFLFSVNPKEQYLSYLPLFKKIIDSVEFPEGKEG